MTPKRTPWGDSPPRKPKVGSGRAALAKRARARGGSERRSSAEAARRALDRGSKRKRRGDGLLAKPMRGAWNEIVRQSKSVQKRFLVTQRMRNVALTLAAIWVVWTFLLGDASVIRLWSVKRENVRLDAQILELHAQETTLKKEVNALNTGRDPQLIEDLAREEHAMVRSGEQLVRFVPEKTD